MSDQLTNSDPFVPVQNDFKTSWCTKLSLHFGSSHTFVVFSLGVADLSLLDLTLVMTWFWFHCVLVRCSACCICHAGLLVPRNVIVKAGDTQREFEQGKVGWLHEMQQHCRKTPPKRIEEGRYSNAKVFGWGGWGDIDIASTAQ
eukprot:3096791-Amphidinium_carterae.1